jgi:hypothetical protein
MGEYHRVGAWIIVLLAAAAVAGCGSATSAATTTSQPAATSAVTTATQSAAVIDERELERAINAEAEARLGTYHPTNGPYPMTTQCTPTTSDLDNWSCVTRVQSSVALGTVACKISTDVTSRRGNFTWSTPDPLLSPTTDCDQLAGNLGGR